MYYSNKSKNHIIISMMQKKYLKNLKLFHDKNTQKKRNKESFLNLIKDLLLLLLFHIILEVLGGIFGQKKKKTKKK